MASMDNSILILNEPKIIEDSNILKKDIIQNKWKKRIKVNLAKKNISNLIIILCLFLSFLLISGIIPIKDYIGNIQFKTNLSKQTTLPKYKDLIEQSNLANKLNLSSQSNLSNQINSSNELNLNLANESQSLNGNIGLNTNYEKINANDDKYIYIPIVGINDIHGYFFPKINNIIMDNQSLIYKTGGLEYVTKYLNILREDFGSNRVLFFDGGDFYQGGIDSVLFDGEIMLDYFNLVGLNGSTIGNHEFDYAKSWIESKYKK